MTDEEAYPPVHCRGLVAELADAAALKAAVPKERVGSSPTEPSAASIARRTEPAIGVLLFCSAGRPSSPNQYGYPPQ